MRTTDFIAASLAVALGGCTFGLGENVSFAIRESSLSGELADGAFVASESTVTVVPRGEELDNGVMIFVEGNDDAHAVATQLEFEGNLGALCPGSRVELEGRGERLAAVDASGAPAEMLSELSALRLTMQTSATAMPTGAVEELRPQRVVVASHAGTDGFSRMEITSVSTVDGEERTVTTSFEIARVLEDTSVPGWEGETWDGQPIANWE